MLARRRVIVASLIACSAGMVLSAGAVADSRLAIGRLGQAAISADAGVAAWVGTDRALHVAAADGSSRVLLRPAPAQFDVGAFGARGAWLAFAGRCSRARRRCAVYGLPLTAPGPRRRMLAGVPAPTGRAPVLSVDQQRLAYAVPAPSAGPGGCDAILLRTPAGSRRLAYGPCGTVRRLDLQDGALAVVVTVRGTHRVTAVARLVDLATGRATDVARANRRGIGSVSLDGDALYTTVDGLRRPSQFVRFDRRSGVTRTVRAFTALTGAFAVTDGRSYYGQKIATRGGFGHLTASYAVIAGRDPFAPGHRLLPAHFTAQVVPAVAFADAPAAVLTTVTRLEVARDRVLGRRGVANVRVAGSPPLGPAAATDGSGHASLALPDPLPPRLTATVSASVDGATLRSTVALTRVFAHVSARTSRAADGRLTVSGTIDPPQPGRRIRLDRRLGRSCGHGADVPPPSPSTAATPAGCIDAYTVQPLATGAVSEDGATFELHADGLPAGAICRVSLDFAHGLPVYAGETPAFAVG